MKELEFKTYCKSEDKVVYYLYIDNEEIGNAEGHLTPNGLVPVVKIYPEFQGKGYGFKAFSQIISYFQDVECILASWNQDEEFSWCKNGMSTNLLKYKESIHQGKTKEESTFLTPTGKWCCKLGYQKCKIIVDTQDRVEVIFYKK